jgi:filamentous hemagglutinin
VLYLAHANGRVAPNGALIQGRDVNLISGGELVNVGTLRATNNLAVSATNIGNAGLMEAGGRLDMLATESIRNAQGGIIAGREVSLTALTGDVINERSVTRLEGRAGGEHVTKDLVDTAARIEAANNLTITAGQDIGIVGGAVQAGGNIDLDAGRDLIIASQEGVDSHEYQRRRVSGHDTSITQYGSEVKAGGNLTATAGQDLSIVASEIEARRDLALQAGRDVTLAAAANEEHSYAKGKKGKTKYERQEDDVEQQSAEVKAGGDLTIDAGRDLRMVASKASAGDEAYLVAGDKLELLAANDSQYSLYDMNKKGGWGSKKTQRDEVTDVKAVGSEITSGGDLTLESGGDQLYQGAKLASGADLTIDSGGSVTFEAVKDMHQESHEKSKSNAGWFSMKGEGRTDETVRQSELVAKGDLVINAVGKIHVDVRQVNQQTVSESIDAMVKADPKLAWLKQVEAQGGVDWRQVKEIHDSFKYSNSGLGPAAQLAIAIVMAAVVGPAAAAWANGGITGAVVGAVAAGASTNASVSVINNRGNLGAVVKDVTSSDAMKGYVISGVTAGLTAAYFDGWTGTKTDIATGKVIGPKLYTLKGVGQFAANQTLQNGTSMLLSKALGQGGSASEALKGALFNTLAAASFNAVGDYTHKWGIENGSLPKIAIHAMVGGLLSKATGGDFKTGALAAGANEALVVELDKLAGGNESLLTMSSQIVGVLAAASQEDANAASLNKAAWVAKNGTQYNFLGDHSAKQRDEARDSFRKDGGLKAARELVKLEGADQRSDKLLEAYKRDPSSLTQDDMAELTAYLQVYAFERMDAKGPAAAQASLSSLLGGEQIYGYGYPYAGTSQDKIAWSDAQRSQLGLVEKLAWTHDRSADEQTYLDARGALRNAAEQQGLANLGDPAIYFLTGSIGSTIRAVAATNGALQFTQGAKQAVEGDGWNAAGNMVAGLLGMATLGAGVRGGAGSVVTSDLGSIRPVVGKETLVDAGGASAGKGASGGAGKRPGVDGEFGHLDSLNSAEFDRLLFQRVGSEAEVLIKAGDTAGVALSRAGVPGRDYVSEAFTNISAKVPKFPGIERFGEAKEYFTVVDQGAFMRKVGQLYADTGTPLTPQVKGMIENLVSNGKRFDVQNGIPGLHAEVRAVNSALTRYPKVSIDDVKVATYKLAPKQGQGDKFEACSNCSGVLKDADVISGRKH